MSCSYERTGRCESCGTLGIYAFLYGAGDKAIGKQLSGDEALGKKVKKKFLKATPAIAMLRQAVENALVEKYHGQIKEWKRKYLKGLDGRHLHVRSLHSALNLLLQSCGALICKKWIVLWEQNLIKAGYKHGEDFQFMAWVHKTLCTLNHVNSWKPLWGNHELSQGGYYA